MLAATLTSQNQNNIVGGFSMMEPNSPRVKSPTAKKGSPILLSRMNKRRSSVTKNTNTNLETEVEAYLKEIE